MSNKLLESYIRNVLLKESIYQSIKTLTSDLLSVIKNFETNALGSQTATGEIKKGDFSSIHINMQALAHVVGSQKPDDFNTVPTRPYGLGYNPFDEIKDLSPDTLDEINGLYQLYTKHIKKLEDLIKNNKNVMSNKKNRRFLFRVRSILNQVLMLSKHFNNPSGKFKVIGAGVNRIVVEHKEASDYVIKIAISSKGRRDNKGEIDFGRYNAELFPRVFEEGKNHSWYIIEKIIPFESGIKNPELMDYLKRRFRKSLNFIKSLGITKINDDTKLISYIVNQLYFTKGDLDIIHDYGVDNQTSLLHHLKSVIYQSLLGKEIEKQHIDAYKVVDDSFDLKLADLLSNWFMEETNNNIERANRKARAKIRRINSKELQNEFGDLYDFIITRGITDGHANNLGFRKDGEGNYSLLMLDIGGGLDGGGV